MRGSDESLRALRDRPFELLQALEKRSREAASGHAGGEAEGEEWVGVGCLLGRERYLIPREEVREVMILPTQLTRVPGAREWVAGLANLRGQLLTVVDLRAFLGAGSSRGIRSARVLVANQAENPVGIIVDELYGFRRFLPTEFDAEIPDTEMRCERFLIGACRRGEDTWPVLSLKPLLAAEDFRQAAA